jgi:hypothetical protein
MPEEAVQFRSAATEAAEAAPGVPAEIGHRVGLRVEQLAFDRAIAQLLGIEVRGVGRQPLDLEVGRVPRQEGPHRLGLVGAEAVCF